MALQFYESVQGLQVKRDHDFSNLTLECDAIPVYPTASARHVERNPGKIAVEIDICDLEVAKLIVHQQAEICDIICPVDFNVLAGRNINMTADNDITLSTPGPGTGDILVTTAGAGSGAFIDLVSDDDILLQANTGGTVLNSHIRLDTSTGTTTVLEVEVGTVTQGTITVAVTLNAISGVITLATGAIVQDTPTSFILNNTKIATDSLILLTFEGSAALAGVAGALLVPSVAGTIAAGAARIQVSNVGSATTGAIAPGKVHFLVLNPI